MLFKRKKYMSNYELNKLSSDLDKEITEILEDTDIIRERTTRSVVSSRDALNDIRNIISYIEGADKAISFDKKRIAIELKYNSSMSEGQIERLIDALSDDEIITLSRMNGNRIKDYLVNSYGLIIV